VQSDTGFPRADAENDFLRARRRQVLSRLAAWLRREPDDVNIMLPFDEVVDALGRTGERWLGPQVIRLDSIVGSMDRTRDFDRRFRPTSGRVRERWQRLALAARRGESVPPIEVYRIGELHFIIDGHHRVSVARNLGRPAINARVINVRTRAPLGPHVDPAARLCAAEYAAFLDVTQLHRTRPEARLECSRLGRYDEILHHIEGHRYFLSREQSRDVPLQEAAASWYDRVYRPIAEVIRKHDVLDRLPGWTEADVYVELTRRWLALSEKGEPAGPDPAVRALLAENARSWWRRRRKILLPE
jgi:hypothetical protein